MWTEEFSPEIQNACFQELKLLLHKCLHLTFAKNIVEKYEHDLVVG